MSNLPFDSWVAEFEERRPATRTMKVCLDSDENYDFERVVAQISPETRAHFSFEVEIHSLMDMGIREEDAICLAKRITQERHDKGYFK
jgi:hypothetical protein